MANRADPDEMARYEPSHLDPHCLQRYMYWSAEMNWLNPKPRLWYTRYRIRLVEVLSNEFYLVDYHLSKVISLTLSIVFLICMLK